MAWKINGVALLFLLLLLMGGDTAIAVSTHRKLIVDVGWEEVNKGAAAGRESSSSVSVSAAAAVGDVDINNHHTIPIGSWDSGQNGP